MASSQPNAWQPANRGNRHPSSNSRTPQNRSGTASPINPAPTSTGNVWTQRNNANANANANNATPSLEEQHTPLNSFNSSEVKAFLSREAPPAAYKPQDAAGGRGSGGAWGAKPGNMSNGQPFFTQLAKQVATLTGGG